MMHPKLYLYGKRGYRMLSLCPSELETLFQMYSSIKAKMHEIHCKLDEEILEDEQKAFQCMKNNCIH